MPELSALRALLKDRQVKEGALGTVESNICLNLSLITELSELEAEKAKLEAGMTPGDPKSLAGAGKADTTKIDREIRAKEAEIRANSITVRFRAVSSVRYQEIANRFDDPDKADWVPFLDALVAECYLETRSEGEKVDIAWAEIAPEVSFGEIDEIRSEVFTLNRRRLDVPYSLTPSKETPRRGATPKPA
jgi:hypothetical protein